MSDEQCYDQLRELRWPEGCQCPFCDSHRVSRRGFDDQHPSKQRYQCKGCGRRFDDLTAAVTRIGPSSRTLRTILSRQRG